MFKRTFNREQLDKLLVIKNGNKVVDRLPDTKDEHIWWIDSFTDKGKPDEQTDGVDGEKD